MCNNNVCIWDEITVQLHAWQEACNNQSPFRIMLSCSSDYLPHSETMKTRDIFFLLRNTTAFQEIIRQLNLIIMIGFMVLRFSCKSWSLLWFAVMQLTWEDNIKVLTVFLVLPIKLVNDKSKTNKQTKNQ